jgi:hypothetical protein
LQALRPSGFDQNRLAPYPGGNAIGPAFERSDARLAGSRVCEILGVLLDVF